jgi:hypothetical protein
MTDDQTSDPNYFTKRYGADIFDPLPLPQKSTAASKAVKATRKARKAADAEKRRTGALQAKGGGK